MLAVERGASIRAKLLENEPFVAPQLLLQPDAPIAHAETPARRDLLTFDAMIAGRIPVEEGMQKIAMSGGWPIRTGRKVIFAVVSNEGPWRIAGSDIGWDAKELESQGNLHFRIVDGDPGGMYKLVTPKGDWIADPMSRQYGYDDNGEFSRIKKPDGPHLERWPGMSDGQLLPRTVRVWVPAKKATHHLYAHDGWCVMNPTGPWGGWKLNEAVGSATLIAAIDSTDHRRDEYTHVPDKNGDNWAAGRGDQYVDFVKNVVQPLIERQYGAPRRRGIIGSSLGGLISVHAALRHQNNYDFVGCLSGTLGWGGFENPNSGQRVEQRIREIGRLPRTKFYFDSGGNPGAGDNYDSTRRTADAFADANYRWNKDLWHWHEPGAGHNEDAWSKRVFRPVELFERL